MLIRLKLVVIASPKQTAVAAVHCSSGPPACPGKMALDLALEYCSLHQDQVGRGATQGLVRGA